MALFLLIVSQPLEPFSDFIHGYYPAGRNIIQNRSILYNIGPAGGFVNLPIVAFLFTPFSFLNRHLARLSFAVCSVIAVFASVYFLVKLTKVSGWQRIALFGLFVMNGPLYYSLRQGNATHFVLCLLLAGFFCIQLGRDFLLGILLAIATILKPPILLTGIYFTLRKKWLVTAGFGLTMLGIIGASVLLLGRDIHYSWYHQIIQPYSGKPVSAYNVQSVDGFLSRLITTDKLMEWVPMEVDWHYKLMRYALISLLLGISIWICWVSKPPATLEQKNLEFSIVICLLLIISPISWTHYYLFLLLPFGLYIGNQLSIPRGNVWSTSIAATIFLTSQPVNISSIENPVLNFWYSKFLVSHYFFGGILFLGLLLAARWYTSKRGSQESR
ncbi:glycosyltransferase family 87 protein [Cylindrospermum stagnale]|nr:glycosyltransferase family 87 protein [Cylindrospermum stagnale]